MDSRVAIALALTFGNPTPEKEIVPDVVVKSTATSSYKITETTTQYRQSIGHSHTCSRGHTWDHTMDGGNHNCPFCGQHVTRVDTPSRMISISSFPRKESEAIQYQLPPNNCPGGICNIPQTTRFRLFR